MMLESMTKSSPQVMTWQFSGKLLRPRLVFVSTFVLSVVVSPRDPSNNHGRPQMCNIEHGRKQGPNCSTSMIVPVFNQVEFVLLGAHES